MKCTILFIIYILLNTTLVHSQFTFRGTVVDKENYKIIEDATISLLNSKNIIFDFTYTNQEGVFSITSTTYPDFISISILGYERLIIPIKEVKCDNIYPLISKKYEIKEVKITSNRIQEKKDTLIYSVSGFRMPQDRNIADILKKMPGIEVLPSGQIKFEDKPISKLYIENMDLMGDRYALATNNLSGKIIKEVQIYRDHQAIAALRGKSFNDQAAMNLVLTDEARYAISGSIDLGIGYSEDDKVLWDTRFVGLLLGKSQQNLSLYKTNNTGEDLSDESQIQNKDYDIDNQYNEALLTTPSLSIGQIDEQRYLINQNHLLGTNHLYKINETNNLRGQFTYQNKDIQMQEKKTSSYFYPEETVLLTEEDNISFNINSYAGEIDYQLNKKKTYIRNHLVGDIKHERAINPIITNNNPIETTNRIKEKNIANYFQLIHSYGSGHIFKLLSINSFSTMPQKLSVIPGLYEEILNEGESYDGFTQHVQSRSFHSHTSTELQLKIANIYMNLKVGIKYNNQKLNSSLYCTEDERTYQTPNTTFYNNLTYTDTQIYSTPSFRYQNESWNIRLDIPFSYHQYQLSNEKHKIQRIFIEPTFHIIHNLNEYWEITHTLNFQYQVPNINQLYNNYIFTTYRNASSESDFYNHRVLFHNTTLKFNNPLNGLFWSLGGTVMPSWKDRMLSIEHDGILSSSKVFNQKHHSLYWSIRSRLSKSFGLWKLFIALTGDYHENRSKSLLSNEITPYTSKNFLLSFNYALQPCQYISIEGNEKFFYSALSSDITINTYSKYTRNELTINLFPSSKWSLKWNHLYLLSHKPISSSIYFMDIALSFLYKKIEVQLKVNNILNKHQFQQTVYSSMSESSTINYFRSREALVKIAIGF
ncbi:hypothetical protein [Bacteroides oleiciplenus]|uniref:TonB-dependent receptor n=1 Tax=Bacteroides oleiciplenus TaxID=626931 RepID=A0A3E5B1I1_9BACE|nr:hypothetical protein [Bacteroides oleiciplenus]RGN31392.1 hypothetical protein DXB65_21020 [Bacteroides oleiciplenus]